MRQAVLHHCHGVEKNTLTWLYLILPDSVVIVGILPSKPKSGGCAAN